MESWRNINNWSGDLILSWEREELCGCTFYNLFSNVYINSMFRFFVHALEGDSAIVYIIFYSGVVPPPLEPAMRPKPH